MKKLSHAHLVSMMHDFPAMKLSGNHNCWAMLCPFHADRRDRAQFFVDLRSKKYHCLGCGERGDLEQLERKLKEGTITTEFRVL